MTGTIRKPREATGEDKENILRVIGSYSQAKWDKPIAKKYFDDFFHCKKLFEEDRVYVLEDNHNIVGTIGYHVDKYETNKFWLGWFYVHSDYEKKGYGEHLFKFVKGKLKSKNVKKLFVNTSSHKFYKTALLQYIKYGFKLEAVIKNYYERNEDQLILSIDI